MTYNSNNLSDADLKNTKTKASTKGLDGLKDSVATLGQDIRDDSTEIAAKAKGAAQEKVAEANACAAGYVDDVKNILADKPLQTVAVAFAAGAVLTALLGRR